MANSSADQPFGKQLDCIQDPRRHGTRHHLYDVLLIELCTIDQRCRLLDTDRRVRPLQNRMVQTIP